MSNKIINNELPTINKYCNMREIQTRKYTDLTTVDKQYIVNFLKNYFLRTNSVNYLPTIKSFESYFENHIHPSFISTYSKDITLFDYHKNEHFNSKEIIQNKYSEKLNSFIKNCHSCHSLSEQ
jgi:hypothetical protein